MKTWQNLTDLMFEEDVNAEMVKKYRGTILGITNKQTTVYAQYQGYNKGRHTFVDGNQIELALSKDTDCTVFIPKVAKGLYNTKSGCVSLFRNPYRQYKRGLSRDSVCIETLSSYCVDLVPRNRFSDEIFGVLNADAQAPLTLDEALVKLPEIGSVAMNRDFALSLPHTAIDNCDASLWYHTCFIGVIRGKEIHMINPVFRQEVLDTQHLWCNNYNVV